MKDKFKPRPFQKALVKRAIDFYKGGAKVVTVASQAGSGKTYMAAMIAEELIVKEDISRAFCKPVWYVTAKPVVHSSRMKILANSNLTESDVWFVSYSSLRAKLGEEFFTKVPRKDLGSANIFGLDDEKSATRDWVFQWKNPWASPQLVILDECHKINRVESQTHEMFMIMTELSHGLSQDVAMAFPNKVSTKFLLMSATPLTKPIHASFSVRILESIPLLPKASPTMWKNESHRKIKGLIGGLDPNEVTSTGMRRLIGYLEEHNSYDRVPTITTKYKRSQQVNLIPFSYDWQKADYKVAIDDYLREKEALGQSPATKRLELVEYMKLCMRAEEIRWPELSTKAHRDVQEGYQVTIACGYQQTIARVVTALARLGYKRNDISIIWGGSDMFSPWEETYTEEEQEEIFSRAFQGEEIDIKVIKGLVKRIIQKHRRLSAEDLQIMKDYNLGPQKDSERQEEIDRFQRGESKICLFTYKAGSVGLDLNHSSEYFTLREDIYTVENADEPTFSVTRKDGKELGHNLPCPRRGYLTPIANPVEFIQAMGRAHRLNSLSNTSYEILFFKGTFEEKSARILGPKLGSIAIATASRESWSALSRHSSFISGDDALLGANVGGDEVMVDRTETDEILEVDEDEGED